MTQGKTTSTGKQSYRSFCKNHVYGYQREESRRRKGFQRAHLCVKYPDDQESIDVGIGAKVGPADGDGNNDGDEEDDSSGRVYDDLSAHVVIKRGPFTGRVRKHAGSMCLVPWCVDKVKHGNRTYSD